jgi:uncharacterized Tic20 family protein
MNQGVPPHDGPDSGGGAYEPTQDDRTWAILCHVGSFSWYIGVPGLITVLIIWLVKKDQSPYVDYHGKESLNFQISMLLWVAIGIVTLCVGVGFVILILDGIFNLVMVIVASIKASNGEYFRYPLTLRLIK